jgi:hypothetical protein
MAFSFGGFGQQNQTPAQQQNQQQQTPAFGGFGAASSRSFNYMVLKLPLLTLALLFLPVFISSCCSFWIDYSCNWIRTATAASTADW